MMSTKKQMAFRLSLMGTALLTAYNCAYAQRDEELMALTKPASSIALGAGYVSKDAPRFGQYTGLDDEGLYGLVNIDVNKRDDSTGTWIRFNGRNLGLENRDMRFMHERQGEWAYYLDYNEIPRFEPYTVNTAVTGIGSAIVTVPTSSAAVEVPVHLKMKREALGVGYSRVLGNGFDFQLRARNEEKNGARIFSRGYLGGTSVWEFTPEPINSSTRQLDAILGYTTKKLYIAGSYYGSWYDNHNTALTIAGGNPALTINPIALPPDTQSHQLALSGNYAFTPSTRANFKAAYTRSTQDDAFISVTPVLADIAAQGDLDGRVDTTLLQFGISARPTSKLSLLADARYEDRNDKTPVRTYTTEGVVATSTHNGRNEPRAIATTAGKLEAGYQLPLAVRVTGGIEYIEKDRREKDPQPARAVSFRNKTEEISYRLLLQRSMSETVSGSLAYVYSDRTGSDFLPNLLNNGTPGLQLIAPLHLSDRVREKVRLSLSWAPIQQLSAQFQTEYARDDYDPQSSGQGQQFELGLRDGTARNHSLDVSYAFSDAWQANAWVSKNETIANRASRASPTLFWASRLVNDAKSFGLGLRGKPSAKLEIGADLSHSEIEDVFQQQTVSGTGTIASLPGFYTRQSTVKLFGTYAVQKNASVRLDYIYDRYSSNDWTWSQWTYSDGTTLSQQPRQSANFFGVTYIYRFY